MSVRLPNGTRFAVSQTVSAPAAISALSNANPAVATAGVPPAAGAIVILNSGWPDLAESPARVGDVDGSTFELENVDTTDLARFPAGEGIGTFRTVTSFLSLTQVINAPLSGGDQNYTDYRFLDDQSNRQRRMPTFKSAMGYELELGYDPDAPWHAALLEMDRKQELVVLRESTPAGENIYYSGYLSYNGVPTKNTDQIQVVRLSFSINSDPARYEAL